MTKILFLNPNLGRFEIAVDGTVTTHANLIYDVDGNAHFFKSEVNNTCVYDLKLHTFSRLVYGDGVELRIFNASMFDETFEVAGEGKSKASVFCRMDMNRLSFKLKDQACFLRANPYDDVTPIVTTRYLDVTLTDNAILAAIDVTRNVALSASDSSRVLIRLHESVKNVQVTHPNGAPAIVFQSGFDSRPLRAICQECPNLEGCRCQFNNHHDANVLYSNYERPFTFHTLPAVPRATRKQLFS